MRGRLASRSTEGTPPRCQELLARAQRLRPRLTYALPYFAVQTRLELARAYLTLADAGGAATMLREIDTIARRQPDLEERFPAEADELRASLTTLRTHAPGASTLTEAELRLLPYLATHLSFRETGRARVPLPPHGEVPRDGDLPQAQRGIPQRRGRPRPRARAALGTAGPRRAHAIGAMTTRRPRCVVQGRASRDPASAERDAKPGGDEMDTYLRRASAGSR